MKLQEHIDKISWSFADKLLFVLYGFVHLFQMTFMDTGQLGLYALFIGANTWIFIIGDFFALQGIIQFGANKSGRGKVNLLALMFISIIAVGFSFLAFVFKAQIAHLFNQQGLIEILTYLPLLSLAMVPRTFNMKLLYRDHNLKGIFFVDLVFFGIMSFLTIFLVYNSNAINFNDLAILYIIGTASSSLFSIIIARKQLTFNLLGCITIRRFVGFSLPMTLQAAMHSLPRQLDSYFIIMVFSPAVAGIYYSAKTLYRFFEEAGSAAYGLLYPPAVKLINNKDLSGLRDLMTKGVSFMFAAYLLGFVLIQAGIGELLITTLLPERFYAAIPQFKILSIGILAIPFYTLSLIINASGRPDKVLKFITYAISFTIIAYAFVAYSAAPELIPLGLVLYNIIYGVLCYLYIKSNLGFPASSIFRAFRDTKHYIVTNFLNINK